MIYRKKDAQGILFRLVGVKTRRKQNNPVNCFVAEKRTPGILGFAASCGFRKSLRALALSRLFRPLRQFGFVSVFDSKKGGSDRKRCERACKRAGKGNEPFFEEEEQCSCERFQNKYREMRNLFRRSARLHCPKQEPALLAYTTALSSYFHANKKGCTKHPFLFGRSEDEA